MLLGAEGEVVTILVLPLFYRTSRKARFIRKLVALSRPTLPQVAGAPQVYINAHSIVNNDPCLFICLHRKIRRESFLSCLGLCVRLVGVVEILQGDLLYHHTHGVV